jgi:hypothetical protein
MPSRAGKTQTVFSSFSRDRADAAVKILGQAGYLSHVIPSRQQSAVPGREVLYTVNVPCDELRAASELLATSHGPDDDSQTA